MSLPGELASIIYKDEPGASRRLRASVSALVSAEGTLWGRDHARAVSLPTRGRRAAQVVALPVFRPCYLLVIGLTIRIKITRLQALASASSCEVQNGPQDNPSVGSVWVRPRSCLNDAAFAV